MTKSLASWLLKWRIFLGIPLLFPVMAQPGLGKTSESTKADANANLGQSNPEGRDSVTQQLPQKSGGPQSLRQWIETAFQENPNLQKYEHAIKADRQKAAAAGSLPDPMVSVNKFGHPLETAAGSQSLNAQVSQKIPWPTRLAAKKDAAGHGARKTEAQREDAKLALASQIKETVYDLYVVRKQIEVNRLHQQTLDTLSKVALSAIRAGRGDQRSVLRVTIEENRLKAEVAVLKRQRRSLMAKLEQLVGRPVDNTIGGDLDPKAAVEQTGALRPAGELFKQARERHPAVEAALAAVRGQEGRRDAARLARRPDFTLRGNWMKIEENRPPSEKIAVGKDAWSVGVGVSLPLWGGKYSALEDEAIQNLYKVRAEKRRVTDRLRERITAAHSQVRSATDSGRIYLNQILPQSRQNLEVSRNSYSQGDVPFTEVIEDFRELLRDELATYRVLGRFGKSMARLQRWTGMAEGRLFEGEER